jgi:integrase
MNLTRPQQEWIEQNETLKRLKNRMLVREGKSEETLRRYLDGPKNFTAYMKASSADNALQKLRESEDITDVLDKWIGHLQKTGKTPINIKSLVFGVKKWMFANRVNGVDWEFIGKPKVAGQIRDRIPSHEELRIILSNKVALRDKALFMTAASSGLRLGTVTTLKVKDFQPIEELGMITVEGGAGRKLAKGKEYKTFVTPETRKTIEDYLSTRGHPEPEEPLFAKSNGEPLSNYVQNTSRMWRRLVKRAGLLKKIKGHRWIDLHAHTLRKFFQTRCKLAGCSADFVDYWMGHHPAKADEYLNNSYFRPELEASIAEYRKAVPDLTIFDRPTAQNKRELEEMKSKIVQLEKLYKKLLAET